MAHEETNILNKWLLKNNRWGTFFRVQVGRFFAGYPVKEWTENGIKYITLKKAYPVQMGVTGQADYQGFHSMVIEPRHVGMKIAVYCVIEGKSKNGIVSDEQGKFLAAMKKSGAIAMVVRSPDDVPPEI